MTPADRELLDRLGQSMGYTYDHQVIRLALNRFARWADPALHADVFM